MKDTSHHRPLLVLALAGLLQTLPVHAAPNLLSLDDPSCQAWQAGANDADLRAQQLAWLRGLLSGHNYARQNEQVSTISNGTIDNFITRYCKDHPQGSYAEGGLRMSDRYSGRDKALDGRR